MALRLRTPAGLASWWRLPRARKEEYLAEGARYGLNRRQVRYRYGLGWNPRAEPPQTRGRPITPVALSPRDRALQRVQEVFSLQDKWNETRQRDLIDRAGPEAWPRIASATDNELIHLVEAGFRDDRGNYTPGPRDPDWLWMRRRREWTNVLWYH